MGRPTRFSFNGAGLISISGESSYYGPKLDRGSFAGELGAKDWWRQVLFALDPATVFSRRDIVLGAANQDGGAHVDPAMEAKYARMAYLQEHGVLVAKSPDGETRVPLYGYHLIALRQIAYELLHSDKLVALAT